MRLTERVVLYSLSAGALAVALLSATGVSFTPRAHARVDGGSADPAVKIAVVSLMKITDELMDSERFKPAREELDEQISKELIQPAVETLQELEKKIQDAGEQSPDAPKLRQEFMRARGVLAARQQEASQRAEAKVGEQLKECFKLVRESAAAIAEKQGYTYVMSSMRPEDDFQTGPVQATIRDVLSRPVLAFPKTVDLTEEVREDLKL